MTLALRGSADICLVNVIIPHKIADAIGVYAKYGYEDAQRSPVDIVYTQILNVLGEVADRPPQRTRHQTGRAA